MRKIALDHRLVVGLALLVGLILRALMSDFRTTDWADYYEPWYNHALRFGWQSLKDRFTEYTPLYGYLLIAGTALDGVIAPITIVKCLSYPFELGCALVGARLARLVDPRPQTSALAFAALWLSPSVLHNGAMWAQNDSMWTFFLLLSLWAACIDRPRLAVLGFSIALAVKLQAVFFAPFLLGYLLSRRVSLGWFALAPLIYFALALPVLIAGRPLTDVATVYFSQATYYQSLWMNAANLYIFIPNSLYHPAVEIGVAVAAIGGLALSWYVARARQQTPEGMLLAGGMSLVLMPFLLPKMHDRYFFAFDAVIVILAVARPLYRPVAIAALVNSWLCYLPFEGKSDFGQHATGLQSLIIVLYLAQLLVRSSAGRAIASDHPERDRMSFLRPSAALWFSYLAYWVVKIAIGSWLGTTQLWPEVQGEPLGLLIFLACLISTMILLRLTAPLESPISGATEPAAPHARPGLAHSAS